MLFDFAVFMYVAFRPLFSISHVTISTPPLQSMGGYHTFFGSLVIGLISHYRQARRRRQRKAAVRYSTYSTYSTYFFLIIKKSKILSGAFSTLA